MKPLCIFVCTLLCHTLLHAQDTTEALHKDSLIHINLIHSGVIYTFSNQVLSRRTMLPLLNSYPPSALEVRRYKNQFTAFDVSLSVFLAAGIAGVIVGSQKKDATGDAFSRAPAEFTVSITGLITALVLSGTNHHLQKAINTYNSRF